MAYENNVLVPDPPDRIIISDPWVVEQDIYIEQPIEELQKFCVHVFRDIETTEEHIKSKCIRCWLERTYNLTT